MSAEPPAQLHTAIVLPTASSPCHLILQLCQIFLTHAACIIFCTLLSGRWSRGGNTTQPLVCCGVCQYEGRHCADMAATEAMDVHMAEYAAQGLDFRGFTPAELFARIRGACCRCSQREELLRWSIFQMCCCAVT